MREPDRVNRKGAWVGVRSNLSQFYSLSYIIQTVKFAASKKEKHEKNRRCFFIALQRFTRK